MQNFNLIEKRKILLVVAHPDDETLWFYQGINELKKRNEVSIMCLTYSEQTTRGIELIKLGQELKIQIKFMNFEDHGIANLLYNCASKIENNLSGLQFDLLITHPPHGGEKPHPHHIQSFYYIKNYCRRHWVQFGFFSEQMLLENASRCRYILDIKRKKYILNQLRKSVQLLKNESLIAKWGFWLRVWKIIWFDSETYQVFKAQVDLSEKQRALEGFTSQLDILTTYNSYTGRVEYLNLESPQNSIYALSLFYNQLFPNIFKS